MLLRAKSLSSFCTGVASRRDEMNMDSPQSQNSSLQRLQNTEKANFGNEVQFLKFSTAFSFCSHFLLAEDCPGFRVSRWSDG